MATDLEIAAGRYRAAQDAVGTAKEQVRAAQERLRAMRTMLQETIVAEAKRGVRMRDLVDETGLSREWIRQLLRAAGIEPD